MPAPFHNPFSKKMLAASIAAVLVPAFLLVAADNVSSGPASTSQPSTQAATQNKNKKEEDIARVMDFFKATQPDLYQEAQVLKASDPDKFAKLIHGAIGMVNKLEDMRKKSPKLFDLKMKDLELAGKSVAIAKELKRTDLLPAERDQLTHQLSDIVAKQFDITQKYRQQEIDDLKDKLSGLQSQLEDRAKDKDDLIKKRVDDLLQNTPHLDW